MDPTTVHRRRWWTLGVLRKSASDVMGDTCRIWVAARG
jgi:hypothetical protein